jgi:hypothetical protein
MRQIRKVNYRKQLKEKYSLGGILGDIKSISPILNLIPGVGSIAAQAVGMAAGVGAQAAKASDQAKQQKMLQQQQQQQQLQANQPFPNMMNPPRQYPGGGTTPVDTLGFAARSDSAMNAKEINSTRGFKKYQKGGVKSDGPADQTKDQMLNYKNDDALNGYNNARKLLTDYHLNNPQLYEKIQELDTENQGSMAPIVQRMTDMVNHYNSKGMVNDSTRLYERMMNENLSARGSSPMFMSRGQDSSQPYNTTTGKPIFPGYNKPMTSNADPEHFATGGSIHKVQQPQDGNAELEDGEVFKTPQGKMDKVTGNTHAEGGEQYNLPQGTEILGKMKSPNGKMYKEEGEKLMKDYTKYSKILASKPTPIAKKTAKMMLDKVEQKYSQLMQQQEAEKGHLQGQGSTIPLQPEHYTKEELSSNQGRISDYNGADIQSPRDNRGFAQGGTIRNPQYAKGTKGTEGIDEVMNNIESNVKFDPNRINPETGYDESSNVYHYTPQLANQPKNPSKSLHLNSISNSLNSISTYAPIAYNIGEGLFGITKNTNPSQFYNPYEGAALSEMNNRKYDVSPELEANKVSTANYYKNLRQSGANAGQYAGALQAGQIAEQRANADVYSKANNMNNEYRGQYAGMLENAGQQRANTNYQTEMLNEENMDAQNRYIPTALSQLQQAGQVNTQMKNQNQAQNILNKEQMNIIQMMYKNYPFLFKEDAIKNLPSMYQSK